MLDERARAVLNYLEPREITLNVHNVSGPKPADPGPGVAVPSNTVYLLVAGAQFSFPWQALAPATI